MLKFGSFQEALQSVFTLVKKDAPLAEYTTIGVGGKASFFVTAKSTEQILRAIQACREFEEPFRVLGCGSNVIISDTGFPGLVIQNRAAKWQVLHISATGAVDRSVPARFETVSEEYYTTEGLTYSDERAAPVLVRVDSGARFAPLMKSLFRKGITGLQWFAGVPATIGGATYMNMHGGPFFFGDFIQRARLLSGDTVTTVNHDYFQFDYDWSILHKTNEVVLCVDLLLRKGNVENARKLAREWARRKAIQPQKSAGCIFQNLDEADQNRLGLPMPSIGYLLDRVLHLKGKQIGGAIISPRHAAFIENTGQTTASDVFRLAQFIREKAKTELDIELKLEVEFVGKF
ncbi:MAG: UDP-N-acetylmuramate dehydrogenase [bacterium]